ncbi:unnamed protein product [Rotaria socialis]|uniref:Uncharacterized protein n=1 Tax=Rotaria socialis TaxID=392032 RepID=A0A818ADC8_9BILA|nr:unnamed protein product [Rotaria socialis]CAF3760668.1 unnamed protein product [Rotaria socialis]
MSSSTYAGTTTGSSTCRTGSCDYNCMSAYSSTYGSSYTYYGTCSGTLTTRAISALVLALSSMTLLRHQLF